MRLLGEASIIMCNDKHSAHSTVLVTDDLNHAALIGWQDLQKLRVIPASFPAVAAVAQCYREIKTNILDAFPLVFSDTLDNRPMCAQKMRIYLKDGSIPYRVSAPRPIPLRFQEPAVLVVERKPCLLYTSPSPRDRTRSRMPSSA